MGYRSKPCTVMGWNEALGDDDCLCDHANMIVKDERDESIFDQGFDYQGENVEPLHQEPATFEQFVQFHREMCDWHTHLDLQNDLVEHVWDHIGNQ